MNVKQAREATGGLGTPSKMPGKSYGIPAANCPTGSKLAAGDVDGPCRDCYAKRNNYRYPSVQTAQARRLAALRHPDWARAMTFQILRSGETWFRWHDSGDVQDMDHLRKIVEVCEATPNVHHWLPTQEWTLVRQFVRDGGALPANLVVRFSARKYGDAPRPDV